MMTEFNVPLTVEADLLHPLIVWLKRRRQIRDGAVLVEEFPWHGRHIDVALLTASGRTAAFELKLAHNRRVLEQSYLNGASFDRAYVVTATTPSDPNLGQAASLGLGIVHVSPHSGEVKLLSSARPGQIEPPARARLRRALKSRARADV
jgi:hypothetical protein